MGRGLLVVFTLLLAVASGADVLETRDGRVLEGTYLGGTQHEVRFRADGAVQVLARDQVLVLTFVAGEVTSGTPPVPAQTPPVAQSPPPPATLARVPAGTRLQVRLTDSIDPRLAAVGDPFAATLETGLGLDGRAIVPAGSRVEGRVAEVRDGGAATPQLKLELTGLILQGRRLELVTGSQSAAPPAASAANDPATAAAARVGIPAGRMLEFRLLQPVDLHIQ